MNTSVIFLRQLWAILVVPKNLLLRGILSGLIVGFLSIQLFVCVELWRLDLIQLGSLKLVYIQFLLFTFILTNGVSILPIVSSSYLLTLVLYYQAKHQRLTSIQSAFEGAIVGAATGVTICIIGWFIINGRGDFRLFLIRAFWVTIIATISAGWMAKNLAHHIEVQCKSQ